MLVPYEPCRTLRTYGTGLLLMPGDRTEHGKVVFQFNAATICNTLTDDARQASTLTMSKLKLNCSFLALYTYIFICNDTLLYFYLI